MNNLPIYEIPVTEGRMRMINNAKNKTLDEVLNIKEVLIPTLDYNIPATLFTPNEAGSNLIIYLHGGGFTLNCVKTHEFLMRKLANSTKSKVLGIEFRLAPEFKFPIPLNDVITSILWANQNKDKLGIKNIYVGGDSSGGTLALSSSLYLKDLGYKDLINKLFLLYPPLDNYNPGTKSYIEKGYKYPVNRDFLMWCWNNYIPSGINLDNKYLFPLKENNLKELPQTLLIYGECDLLCDEIYAFSNKLKLNNVNSKVYSYPNALHGFILNIGQNSDSDDAYNHLVNYLNK